MQTEGCPMTADGKRSVSVGQEKVRHHGAEVEVVAVTGDGKEVKVTYPYSPSKRPAWVKVEDLTLPETLSNSPIDDSPDNLLYPLNTVLSNGMGETAKVIGRFRADVRLQLGSGANETD